MSKGSADVYSCPRLFRNMLTVLAEHQNIRFIETFNLIPI